MSEPASRSSGAGHRRSQWGAAKRLALLVVVMASIGALCGAGISSFRRGEFSSTATVNDSPASGDLSAAAQIPRTIAPGVVPTSSTISIATDDLEGLLIITATDDAADVAERSATAVAELYVAQAPDATARIASAASRAATPAANRARNILIGLGIGALSGVVFAIRLRPEPVSGPAPTIAFSPLGAVSATNTNDLHWGQSGEASPDNPLAYRQTLDDEPPGADDKSEPDSEIAAQTSLVSSEATPAHRRADPVGYETPVRLNGHTPATPVASEGAGGAPSEMTSAPAAAGVFAAATSRSADAAGPERSEPAGDAPAGPAPTLAAPETDVMHRAAGSVDPVPTETHADEPGADTQTSPPLSTAGIGDPVTPPTPADESSETSAATATASTSTVSQARLDDLVAQISFLDSEVARYRDTLETERIRHARVMAEKSMAADAALDQARRREQAEIERLHRSYRELLADRQIEFERALSTALAEHEQRLEAEHHRHATDLEGERTRRDVEIEAARRRVIDETAEAMRTAARSPRSDHGETDGQLAELRDEVAELTERCSELERTEARQAQEVQMLRRRLLVNEGQGDYRVAHLEEQVAIAEQRLEAERARSAATLAELLARSAAIAAEVDAAREENKSIRAAADEAIASYRQRSRAEYEALVEAADEQKRIALAREADLEARIADLRSR